jgi:hypothetical protein
MWTQGSQGGLHKTHHRTCISSRAGGASGEAGESCDLIIASNCARSPIVAGCANEWRAALLSVPRAPVRLCGPPPDLLAQVVNESSNKSFSQQSESCIDLNPKGDFVFVFLSQRYILRLGERESSGQQTRARRRSGCTYSSQRDCDHSIDLGTHQCDSDSSGTKFRPAWMGCGSSAPRDAVDPPSEAAAPAPEQQAGHGNPSSNLESAESAMMTHVHRALEVEGADTASSPEPAETDLSGTATPIASGPDSPIEPSGATIALKIQECIDARDPPPDLEVTGCKLKKGDMQALREIIRSGKTRSITLARCELRDDQVVEIAALLSERQARFVKVLGLDGNPDVGDAGAAAIAQMLAVSNTLSELSLWGTGVTDKGAETLARALRANRGLRRLWLGECGSVTDAGARALRAALAENSTLEQVGLVCTSASPALQGEVGALAQAARLAPSPPRRAAAAPTAAQAPSREQAVRRSAERAVPSERGRALIGAARRRAGLRS